MFFKDEILKDSKHFPKLFVSNLTEKTFSLKITILLYLFIAHKFYKINFNKEANQRFLLKLFGEFFNLEKFENFVENLNSTENVVDEN